MDPDKEPSILEMAEHPCLRLGTSDIPGVWEDPCGHCVTCIARQFLSGYQEASKLPWIKKL